MKSFIKNLADDDRGALTFEWIVLITLIVLGVVGGYSAMRDAVIDELGDVAQAVIRVDQSFSTIGPEGHPEINYGHWEDDDPPLTICRGRGDEPPITQSESP